MKKSDVVNLLKTYKVNFSEKESVEKLESLLFETLKKIRVQVEQSSNSQSTTNSLNHRRASQADMIDSLLLESVYTIREIAEMCNTTDARVNRHIQHLKEKHSDVVKLFKVVVNNRHIRCMRFAK
jgi:Fic family protein